MSSVLLTALTTPLVLVRIRAKEALLHAHFGDEHTAYCARTSRLVPAIY
jgi:protein-S-isoprenylcysteine O-methyltransferase Ste14